MEGISTMANEAMVSLARYLPADVAEGALQAAAARAEAAGYSGICSWWCAADEQEPSTGTELYHKT